MTVRGTSYPIVRMNFMVNAKPGGGGTNSTS
jgi:hypothetical protein